MKYFLPFLCLLVACGGPGAAPDVGEPFMVANPVVIPTPQKMELGSGALELSKLTAIRCVSWAEQEAHFLADMLATATGYQLSVEVNDAIDGQPPAANTIQLQTRDFGGTRQNEGYELTITPDHLLVTGGAAQGGLQRAFATIQQLLPAEVYAENRDATKRWMLPAVTIKDEPAFAWRGMLLDCSRHFMEKEFVKRYIRLLAQYKMNTLHWHLTEDQGWRIEIDQYPKLTEIGAWRTEKDGSRYGGFYTKEDIREVVAYAAQYNITLVPEIELPGHSQAALAAYPQLSCTGGPFEVETEWGVFKEIYCAGNDSTFTFMKDVLDEVMELFPGQYIHIGGDEVPKYRWEHCSKCQKRMADNHLHDEHELQSWFIGQIGDYLREHNRTLIGWDEIREGGTPEGAIVQSWRGFEGAAEAVKEGHAAIVSPTSHAYFDYDLKAIDLEKVYAFDPVPEGVIGPERALILGGECNMWSERAPQHLVDSKVFPRMLAMAEVLWRAPENRKYEQFLDNVYAHYPRLDALGVTYGFETVPVKMEVGRLPDSKHNWMTVTVQPNVRAGTLWTETQGAIESSTETDSSTTFLVAKPGGQKILAGLAVNGEHKGDTTEVWLWRHDAIDDSIRLATEYNQWYTAGGNNALVDGIRGSNDFRDGHWQGYWGKNLEAVIDLGAPEQLRTIRTSYLQYGNSWIFLPEEVRYYGSMDGEHFEELAVLHETSTPENRHDYLKRSGLFTEAFNHRPTEKTVARYVKVVAQNIGVCPEWHDAAGSDAWIFADEIIVETVPQPTQ